MGDFAQQSLAFLDWFRSQPGTNFHPGLDLVDLRARGAGRGIVATQDIAANVELFSIPRQRVISVENSDLSTRLPAIFSTLENTEEEVKFTDDDVEVIELPSPWIDLILVMIYECVRGDASAWKAYLDVLPKHFDTLMFWSDRELDELQASAVRHKIGKADAEEVFRNKIVPVVNKHKDVFYPEGVRALTDDELVSLAHRMGSTIMAYAFELEEDDDKDDEDEEDGWVRDWDGQMAMGMVPMADMLNADDEFNAHLNHGDESLTMTSIRPIKAGEEVLNYYGALPNCELLRRYGYTSPKHSRYDVVEIAWDTLQKAIDTVTDGKYDLRLDPDELEDSFVLERETGYPDEDGLNRSQSRFATFDEELEGQTKMALAAALGIDPESGATKETRRRLKEAFIKVMAVAIPTRLKEYSTSMAEDEALLQAPETRGRLRMATVVRHGEKQLLHEAQQLASNLLARYEQAEGAQGAGSSNGGGSERQAKRQKVSD